MLIKYFFAVVLLLLSKRCYEYNNNACLLKPAEIFINLNVVNTLVT